MRLTIADVLRQLIAERLAPPESIDRARAGLQGAANTAPPWFARVIAGFGAWFATGLLIAFLVASDLVDGEISAMIVGAVFVASAVLLRRTAEPEQDFKRQLSLAVSLAGQVLLVVGVAAETRSGAAAGLAALAVSVALIVLVPDQVHRFMSALIGTIAAIAIAADLKLVWALGSLGPWGNVVVGPSDLAALAAVAATACVWRVGLRERSRELAEMLEPVGYGMIAALFGVLLFSAVFAGADHLVRGWRAARVNAWHLGPLTTVGITAALVALERSIFTEQPTKPRRGALVAAIAGTVLLGALTLSTPGVVAAVAVLTLGFDRRNRILIGLAIVFLVKFASYYYYSLHMTLLEKSLVLVASGVLLLAGRAYVELRFGPGEAADA